MITGSVNYLTALAVLSTCRSVGDWNNTRHALKSMPLSIEDLARIDQSGLIVKVLGADQVFYHFRPDDTIGSGAPVTAEFAIGYDPYNKDQP